MFYLFNENSRKIPLSKTDCRLKDGIGVISSEKTVLVMASDRTLRKYPDQFSSSFCILLFLFFNTVFLKHLEIVIFLFVYTLKYAFLGSFEYIPIGIN